LYAGADMLLMPSRFEPCGLAQLIGLRYGTIPIVRATGGLADTITDFDPMTDQGIGFSFAPYDAWQLFGTVVRAVETYRDTSAWGRLLRRAMRDAGSWAGWAQQYASLYRSAMAADAVDELGRLDFSAVARNQGSARCDEKEGQVRQPGPRLILSELRRCFG